MAKIVRPVFGRPCYECEEQVPMARIRALEDDARATGKFLLRNDFLCVSCQSLREAQERNIRRAERDSTSITFRR